MDVEELVDKYFDEIEVKEAYYDDNNSPSGPRPAVVGLTLPTEMVREFSRLKGYGIMIPDGAEFWRETGLGKRLRNSDRWKDYIGHEDYLRDILDFLEEMIFMENLEINTEFT